MPRAGLTALALAFLALCTLTRAASVDVSTGNIQVIVDGVVLKGGTVASDTNITTDALNNGDDDATTPIFVEGDDLSVISIKYTGDLSGDPPSGIGLDCTGTDIATGDITESIGTTLDGTSGGTLFTLSGTLPTPGAAGYVLVTCDFTDAGSGDVGGLIRATSTALVLGTDDILFQIYVIPSSATDVDTTNTNVNVKATGVALKGDAAGVADDTTITMSGAVDDAGTTDAKTPILVEGDSLDVIKIVHTADLSDTAAANIGVNCTADLPTSGSWATKETVGGLDADGSDGTADDLVTFDSGDALATPGAAGYVQVTCTFSADGGTFTPSGLLADTNLPLFPGATIKFQVYVLPSDASRDFKITTEVGGQWYDKDAGAWLATGADVSGKTLYVDLSATALPGLLIEAVSTETADGTDPVVTCYSSNTDVLVTDQTGGVTTTVDEDLSTVGNAMALAAFGAAKASTAGDTTDITCVVTTAGDSWTEATDAQTFTLELFDFGTRAFKITTSQAGQWYDKDAEVWLNAGEDINGKTLYLVQVCRP